MASLVDAFRDWLAPVMEPFLSGFFNESSYSFGGFNLTVGSTGPVTYTEMGAGEIPAEEDSVAK